ALFRAVHILGIEKLDTSVTIGNNLQSGRLGSKGIIKVAEVEFSEDELNRIAIIAPSAMVNIIRDYEVVEKYPVELPDTLVGLVRCGNPKCITNHEPMPTRFEVADREDVELRCHYCGHSFKGTDIEIIK
ncbi:MAG: aspartate carbamoyltransferase regulatory subunit, partial [Muribaculaceae bacterium]|nr:aspartate carbamoyltransferase regulatory subunit [Muribaculaceae bacterium]